MVIPGQYIADYVLTGLSNDSALLTSNNQTVFCTSVQENQPFLCLVAVTVFQPLVTSAPAYNRQTSPAHPQYLSS